MNHYPRHVGDFIAATIGLSLAERGAYSALLDQYYANEAALPLDKRERYRMAGAFSKAERDAVDYVVSRYFVEQPDGWHNRRADAEIALYRIRADTARNNGAKGGRPPNQKETESVISGLAKQNPDETGSKTNPEPVTQNHNPEVQKQDQGQDQKRVARKRAPPAGKPATRSPKTPIPPDFAPSDRVRAWAAEHGHGQVDEHCEAFVRKCQANGYAYADWDAAFMEAIRGDWARLAWSSEPAAAVVDPAMRRLTKTGQQTAESLNRWIDGEGLRNGTDGP